MATTSRLLEPLNEDQQLLVDLVSDVYVTHGRWPIFDHIEAIFDRRHKDAWETLYSLPRVGLWNYGPAWWVGLNQPRLKPSRETQIELTIVGMHHSRYLDSSVPVFLSTLRYMVELYRNAPSSPIEPRDLVIDADGVKAFVWHERRGPLEPWSLQHMPTLWRREPATWGGGESRAEDGTWTKNVPRTVLDYEGVATIEKYLDRLTALTAVPVPEPDEAAPSPLGVVAALDYLDATWRVSLRDPLFTFPSAERAAKLTLPANTAEEFDSRLSALGEILRSANKGARTIAGRKLRSQSFDRPLDPFRDYVSLSFEVPEGPVDVLERVLSIRDATQHAEASGRAAEALARLGIGHPVADYAAAWQTVSRRTIRALDAIREAIATRQREN